MSLADGPSVIALSSCPRHYANATPLAAQLALHARVFVRQVIVVVDVVITRRADVLNAVDFDACGTVRPKPLRVRKPDF